MDREATSIPSTIQYHQKRLKKAETSSDSRGRESGSDKGLVHPDRNVLWYHREANRSHYTGATDIILLRRYNSQDTGCDGGLRDCQDKVTYHSLRRRRCWKGGIVEVERQKAR